MGGRKHLPAHRSSRPPRAALLLRFVFGAWAPRQRFRQQATMALSLALSQAGHPPTRVHTKAVVQFGPAPDGFAISRIDLETEGTVPGIDAATFETLASQAKIHCPVSKALAAVEIGLSAKLV